VRSLSREGYSCSTEREHEAHGRGDRSSDNAT
jgi:hypothetical protein